MQKTIVLLFGEMGSGKSYLGKKIAAEMGYLFIDGDALLPAHMRERVDAFRSPTKQMLAELVAGVKFETTWLCNCGDTSLVVSQALYRDEHRLELIRHWKANGFHVECFWVKPSRLQNLKQLWSRKRGLRWIFFWLTSKPWFQAPTHPVTVHENQWLSK